MLQVVFLAIVVGGFFYIRKLLRGETAAPAAHPQLTEDQIKMLSEHTGMSREELVAALSQQLPDVINHLTPQGRVPSEHEASKML